MVAKSIDRRPWTARFQSVHFANGNRGKSLRLNYMKIFNRYSFRPTDDRDSEPPCAPVSGTILIYTVKIRNGLKPLKTKDKEISNLSVSRLNALRRVSGFVLANPECKEVSGFVLANPECKEVSGFVLANPNIEKSESHSSGRGPRIADREFLIYSYAIRNRPKSLKTQGRHHV